MKNLFRPLLAAAFTIGAATTSQAALVAGDVAIIGWIDNGTPNDSFAFVTLSPISAGENIYFTDNGWTGASFRPGTGGISDGDGSETLIKWTATANIAAGRIVQSSAIAADYLFTRNNVGEIPGTTSGQFADLSIGNPMEQISAFQATDSNPLFNPTVQLYLLDDTGGFEAAIDSDTGAIPPGLTNGTTAVTFSNTIFGTQRSIGFITDQTPRTKTEWLTRIANPNNWSLGTGVLPSGTINVVPEPTAALAFATGLAALLTQRRRRQA